MASAKQQENMLLTEHFSWPPISLLDDIINAVNEVLYRCTDTFESGLLAADPALLGFAPSSSSPPTSSSAPAGPDSTSNEQDRDRDPDAYPQARLEIEEGVLKLETLMEGAVDRNFDRLEIWALRNVLCLPREEGVGEWVRLRGYENLQIPSKDNTLTPESLYALRRKLAETRKLHAALQAEKRRNATQIARLRALMQPATVSKSEPKAYRAASKSSDAANPSPFAFLTHAPAAQSLGITPLPSSTTATTTSNSSTAPAPQATPLTTHTTFTTSHLPHLRSLLAYLKPHLAAKPLPSLSDPPTAKEEWSRERREYIERQSRRALERRGVDTRDGVEGAGGSGVGGEEVRGLEGIVEALARRKEGGGEEMDEG